MTQENKHTPGPWLVKANTIQAEKRGNHQGVHLAEIIGQGLGFEAEANAHLIAAAPDLLQFAERVVAEEVRLRALAKKTKNPIILDEWQAVCSLASEALSVIAKARGQQ